MKVRGTLQAAASAVYYDATLADAVGGVLLASDQGKVRNLGARIMECGRSGSVRVELGASEGGRLGVRWVPSFCDHELCRSPACIKHRSAALRRTLVRRLAPYPLSYRRGMPGADVVRFVTLTVMAQETQRGAYDAASKALSRLRKGKAGEAHWFGEAGALAGVLARFEVGGRPGAWVGHWHCIVAGGRWWQTWCGACVAHGVTGCAGCRRRKLGADGWRRTCKPGEPCVSCEWGRCVGDGRSRIVDARVVVARGPSDEARQDCASELVKYCLKPAAYAVESALIEWARTMASVRRTRWLGAWFDVGDEDEDGASSAVMLSAAALEEAVEGGGGLLLPLGRKVAFARLAPELVARLRISPPCDGSPECWALFGPADLLEVYRGTLRGIGRAAARAGPKVPRVKSADELAAEAFPF